MPWYGCGRCFRMKLENLSSCRHQRESWCSVERTLRLDGSRSIKLSSTPCRSPLAGYTELDTIPGSHQIQALISARLLPVPSEPKHLQSQPLKAQPCPSNKYVIVDFTIFLHMYFFYISTHGTSSWRWHERHAVRCVTQPSANRMVHQ